MSKVRAEIECGDCLDILKDYPNDFFDLIMTSPPYANQRWRTYGGIPPKHYVKWFLERSEQFRRVLKPTGTFILNIKESVTSGQRQLYVMELIIALVKEQKWLWTEEFPWVKKNCSPGKWNNRFRDAWERCLHFKKQRAFHMYQDEVMVPIGSWSKPRLKHLGANDKIRMTSGTGSGFGKNISNWLGRDMVYPDNVIRLATETGNKHHSAAFPEALPTWFIKLFTEQGDWVLDPFVGSGTTCRAAIRLGRHSVGIDSLAKNVELTRRNIAEEILTLDEMEEVAIERVAERVASEVE